MKTTTESCRFGTQCVFLPLCLFFHNKEVKNDQSKALAANQKQKKRKSFEFPSAHKNSSSPATVTTHQPTHQPIQTSPASQPTQISTSFLFPTVDFTTALNSVDFEDFSAEFESIQMDVDPPCTLPSPRDLHTPIISSTGISFEGFNKNFLSQILLHFHGAVKV